MKNFKNRQSAGFIGCLILMLCFSCKKIDKEIDRQNAESGIVAFSPESALLGDTVLVYIKTGQENASASLKIGDAAVEVLERKPGASGGRQVETWKIVIPKNAPFGEPSAELTVNGQRKPAFFGLRLTEPPALIEGKVTASLFAGIFREKEYSDCGYEQIYPAKDGALLQAQFGQTGLVACSKTGNTLYVVETYQPYNCGEPDLPNTKTLLRKIENGTVSTLAGGGTDPNGDGLSARLPDQVKGLAVSPTGLLYLSVIDVNGETGESKSSIISIEPNSGKIDLVAGGQKEKEGYYGKIKDGPALMAKLFEPGDLSFDREGNLYFLDKSGFCVRKMDAKGIITTLFGPTRTEIIDKETYLDTDYSRIGHEDGFGNQEAQFGLLTGLATAGNGKIYVVDDGGGKFGGCVRELNPQTGETATVIGLPRGMIGKETGSFKEVSGSPQGGNGFFGMDTDFDGNLLLTRQYGGTEIKLFKIDLQFETVKLIAGGGGVIDPNKPMPGSSARLFGGNITFDDKGNLYIGDNFSYLIRKIEREK